MTAETPVVHLYVPTGFTVRERILCGQADDVLNTHVAELGTQVTCEACRAIMRERDRQGGES